MSISTAQSPAAFSSRNGPGLALPVAKILHWTTAAMVALMLCSGVIMTQLAGGSVANWLYTAHKTCGLIVLALLSARLLYRIAMILCRRWPSAGSGRYIHWLIYASGIAIPLLGWAGTSDYGARDLFFGWKLPEILAKGSGYADLLLQSHAYLAFGLVAIVVAHIGFALHDYVTRNTAD